MLWTKSCITPIMENTRIFGTKDQVRHNNNNKRDPWDLRQSLPLHLSSLNRRSAIVPFANTMIWCHLKLTFYWISIKFYISYFRSRIIMPKTSSFEFIPVSVSFWCFQFTIQWMNWQIHVIIGLNHMDWWFWMCICALVCSPESSESKRMMRKKIRKSEKPTEETSG